MAGVAAILLVQPGMARGAGSGRSTYQTYCVKCHGSSGGGSLMGKTMGAPDLRSKRVQAYTDAELTRYIAEGKHAMPAFQDRLSNEQILSEVRYIRSLGKKAGSDSQ